MSYDLRKIVDELRGFLAFERGWDGCGGETFSSRTIARAGDIVCLLESFAAGYFEDLSVGPCSDGSVEIDVWLHGRELSVIVDPELPEEVILSLADESGELGEGRSPACDAEIESWVTWLETGENRISLLAPAASVTHGGKDEEQ